MQAELWQSLGATIRALPTRAHPGCARAHTVHAAAAPDRPHAAARAAGACGVHQHERARRRRGQRCEHGPGRGPLPGAVHAQPLLSAELHVRVRAGCARAVPRRAGSCRAPLGPDRPSEFTGMSARMRPDGKHCLPSGVHLGEGACALHVHTHPLLEPTHGRQRHAAQAARCACAPCAPCPWAAS